jgi:hypothetical protein
MTCTNWVTTSSVSLITEAEVYEMGGPGFDSGWISVGDGIEIRTIISSYTVDCTASCEPLPAT